MKNKELSITALVVLLIGFESPIDASFASRLKMAAATVAHSARAAKVHAQKVVNSKPVQLASRYALPVGFAGAVALEADLHATTMAKIKEFERSPMEGKAIIPARQTIDDIVWDEDMQKLPSCVKQRMVDVINACGIKEKIAFGVEHDCSDLTLFLETDYAKDAMINQEIKVSSISYAVLEGRKIRCSKDGVSSDRTFVEWDVLGIIPHEVGHIYQVDDLEKYKHDEEHFKQSNFKQFILLGLGVNSVRILRSFKSAGAFSVGGLLTASCFYLHREFLRFRLSQAFEKGADAFACQASDSLLLMQWLNLFKFREAHESKIGKIQGFFSSHPSYESRITMLEAEIARRELARAKQSFTMTVQEDSDADYERY